MFQKLFYFFLFGHLFIALCALVMALQTCALLSLPVSQPLLGFIVSGTLCSYGFHWYLTPEVQSHSPKVQWTLQNKSVHLSIAIAGLVGSCFFIFYLMEYWVLLMAFTFVTFLYSAPKIPFEPFQHIKKFAIGKTIFLSLVWTLVTTALPILVSNIPWQPVHYLFCINRFFFVYPVCILFDNRDRDEDKTEGIRSMITHLNEQGIDILFWSSLTVYFLTTFALAYFSFSMIKIMVLLVPALLLSYLYSIAKNNHSDILYYFILDGLMALSSFLFLLFLL